MQRVLVIGVLVIGILAQHAAIQPVVFQRDRDVAATSTAYARIEGSHADMPTFSTTRRVAFTPRQMFDLVADVERYPQFLPLCEAWPSGSASARATSEILICRHDRWLQGASARPSPAA